MPASSLRDLLFAAASLAGCASPALVEEQVLDDVIYDDAPADSFSRPTSFGRLFQHTWQFGELAPEANIRNPAWTFRLDGEATVEIETRGAPSPADELELARSVVYLYKRRDAGSWARIAKSDVSGDFESLTRELPAGEYRVLIKGIEAEDRGELMLRLGCTGDGCAAGPECLFGDTYYELFETRHGAIERFGRVVLTEAHTIGASEQAQILAAVNESSYEVSTLAEAFAAVDGNEINRDRYLDAIAGRWITAFEYGAGDNSYGAIFVGNESEPVAAIHDGDIEACTLPARACVFGRTRGEAAFMPDLRVDQKLTVDHPREVPEEFEAQIIRTMTFDGEVPTLAEAFELADEHTFDLTVYRHTDGRELVGIDLYAGDTAVGTFFSRGTTTPLAEISDGDVVGCQAF